MRYNIATGVQHAKINVKKYVAGGIATLGIAGAMAIPAIAAPTVSDNANPNACFGQARASYAQGGPNGVLSPYSNGHYISERKGTNPAENAAYIAANCE